MSKLTFKVASMIYGYIRVSTKDQNIENQKNVISRYCIDRRMLVDEWIEKESSAHRSSAFRRIDELLAKLKPEDVVITTELSRLGRSVKDTLSTVENITKIKGARLIMIKENMDINTHDPANIITKMQLVMFSMVSELERHYISERTKEALRVLAEKGRRLGRPPGIISKSIYDKDKERILELHKLGVSFRRISSLHLKYGKYMSLRNFVVREKAMLKKQQG